MSRKKKNHESHTDESWLIPYADILTLLLALFIVLFASSQVDQYKMQKLKMALDSIFSGGSGMMSSESEMETIQILDEVQEENSENPSQTDLEERRDEAIAEDITLNKYKEKLDNYFQEVGLANHVTSTVQEVGLRVTIQDIALFDSGRAELRPEVLPVLKNLSVILEGLNKYVQISGHTDNLPIRTSEYPSNWELSVARAMDVMKYLLGNPKLKPELYSVVGYGEYRPVSSNDTAEGRAANRRVELLIVRSYINDGKKLILP